MRFLSIFLLFILASCAQWARVPSSVVKERHVVFDIDWTIASEVKPESRGRRIVEVEGKKYFIHDGIEEFVEELLRQENVKISFFSGGGFSRNHSLLASVKLSNGRTLEDIAFKILNRDDLTPVLNVAPTEKFSRRYKKDLTKVSKDLSDLIMLDDTEHFVLDQKQEEHVLYIGKTFEHFEAFKEAVTATGEYVPRTKSEWSFARKKLFILNGAVHQAFKESEETGISFSDAMKIQAKELNLGSSEWNEYSNKMYKISLGLIFHNDRSMINAGSCTHLIDPFLTE